MNTRIGVRKYIASGPGQAMLNLSAEAEKSLDHRLFRLVQIRASLINGCAYCTDMHAKDARGRRNGAEDLRAQRVA